MTARAPVHAPIICSSCGQPQRLTPAGRVAEHWHKGQVCRGVGEPPALRCDACGQFAAGDLVLIARAGEVHFARRSFGRFVSCGKWVSP